MSTADEALKYAEFVEKVFPAAMKFVGALFKKHSGDPEAAIRDIRDRSAEIDKMWGDAEEAIKKKHET